MKPKISIITPSVRLEFLDVVKKCLERQIFDSFEWIVVSPFEYKPAIWVEDPPMREGDYYRLNGAWNAGLRKAKGKLFVSIVDGLWFPPDTLEKLWTHYENDPTSCVTGIGHQYDQVVNGKPEHMVWSDPRARLDQGSFYEVGPMEMELCIASLPMKAVTEAGGFDEAYDRGCAISEKELCCRVEKLGYKFYLDQGLEYRAIHHPRLGGSEKWDVGYITASQLFHQHTAEIEAGTRTKLDNL
jgi:hypothetical protein